MSLSQPIPLNEPFGFLQMLCFTITHISVGCFLFHRFCPIGAFRNIFLKVGRSEIYAPIRYILNKGLLDYSTTYLTLPAQLFGTVSDDVSVTENKAVQYFMANCGNVIMAESEEEFQAAKQEMIDGMLAFCFVS